LNDEKLPADCQQLEIMLLLFVKAECGQQQCQQQRNKAATVHAMPAAVCSNKPQYDKC